MMAWNATQQAFPTEEHAVLNDMLRTRSWGLFHHPGSTTFGHHDASGQLSWVLNMCGYKFWVVFRIKPHLLEGKSAEELEELAEQAFNPDNFLVSEDVYSSGSSTPLPWEEFVDTELIVLGPGDLLYVAPSTYMSSN